ncbi:hypothetical protein [Lysobacter olei]
MFRARTLKILGLLLLAYGLLWLPAAFWPPYLDSPIGVLLAAPLLSVYLFHKVGVPGLLEHNGLCGWGWCAPTTFGWLFVAFVLLVAVWLVAWGIAALTASGTSR